MDVALPNTGGLSSLAEGIRLRDPAAEEELVRLFSKRIFIMAVVRTRDPEASRELVQDVLMAVLGALRNGQVRETEKLAAFVHGTARNLINSYLRAKSRDPACGPVTQDLPVTDWQQDLETVEQQLMVQKLLEHLPAGDRSILLLTFVERLKPAEVASQLGLTSEVVRKRKSRAVRKLIEHLKKRSRKRPREPLSK